VGPHNQGEVSDDLERGADPANENRPGNQARCHDGRVLQPTLKKVSKTGGVAVQLPFLQRS